MGWRLCSEIRSLGNRVGFRMTHHSAQDPLESYSRSTAEVLGPFNGLDIHSLSRHRLNSSTVCRHGAQGHDCVGARQTKTMLERRELGHSRGKVSTGGPCDLRPAGGGSGILASGKSETKPRGWDVTPHAQGTRGRCGARAACAGGGQGHPSLLFLTHQQQEQSSSQKWLLEETLSHPALLQETGGSG